MSFTDRIKSVSDAVLGPKYTGFGINEDGPSYILPLVGSLIIIAIIVISVVVSLQYKAKRPAYKLLGPIDLFHPERPVIVDTSTVKRNMTATYTLAVYFMIDTVPDMRSDSTPLLLWPRVWSLNYNAPKEELVWKFLETSHNAQTPETVSVNVKKIPLQRWNQIVMTFEGRTADMYCNGELMSSTTLRNVPPLPNSSITIVPSNVMGKAAYIQVWDRRLPIKEVAHNYIETSDSQGRPYIGKDLLKALRMPNVFCLGGMCPGKNVLSGEGYRWEFPFQ